MRLPGVWKKPETRGSGCRSSIQSCEFPISRTNWGRTTDRKISSDMSRGCGRLDCLTDQKQLIRIASPIAGSGLPLPVCEMVRIMILPRLAPLAAIAFALLFIPGASRAPAGETDRVYARFEIFGVAGFHVLTNRTTIQEIGDQYAIAMDLDTRGLAIIFVDLPSHSEVHGELARGAARPEAYRADVRRNGAERHYAVDFRRDGSVANVATPASSAEPFVVAAEQTRGAVDQ